MADWIGNSNSIYTTLGSSNHSKNERETYDFYATDPSALEIFLNKANEDNVSLNHDIWECAAGEGHLSHLLSEKGYNVLSSDIIDRGYPGTKIIDFLQYQGDSLNITILTNPPYKFAADFVYKALNLVAENSLVIMFLKIQFLEGKARKALFDKHPPKYIYVHSERQMCAKNGDFESSKQESSAVCYAWFVWEKGFHGAPVIKWL